MANNEEKEATKAAPAATKASEVIEEVKAQADTNKKMAKVALGITVAVVVVVLAVLGYWYGVRIPAIDKANEAIGIADNALAMGNDSLALVKFKDVADNYGYDAGNRANLNVAILLYKDKKYDEALAYIDRYDATENVIGASAMSLKGDCLSNLKKYDEALACYSEAVMISKDNPEFTPVFMMKQATVYREQKNYAKEAETYQSIIDNYPTFGPGIRVDMDKLLERAKSQAGTTAAK